MLPCSAARVGLSESSEHPHHSIARKCAAMRARIADERSNELQRRRLLRRTSAHNPVPVFIGEDREVLHRLHISPTGQRFPRAWDVDVPPGALSAALEALTPASSSAFSIAAALHAKATLATSPINRVRAYLIGSCAISNPYPVFRSQSNFPVERDNEPRLVLKFSRWSCAGTGNVRPSLELGPAVRLRVSPMVSRSPQ